jgi:type IV pilus assembly protein PilO
VEVRRYTSRPYVTKDFYTEVPFEVEFDGPYYSMLGFFDRLGKSERIVNVSNLLVASTSKPSDAKAKHTYQYAASESVVATCVTTTYFSHDLDPAVAAAAAAAKPGKKKK